MKASSNEVFNVEESPNTLMVRTLEILWHCNERSNEAEMMGLQSCVAEGVTSIDWNASGTRLLTTGGDRCIRIWEINLNALSAWIGDATQDMTACTRHVCCMKSSWMPMTARWSPHGQLVASGHCDGKIGLWWQERSAETGAGNLDESGEEIWKDFRHLSGHVNDVYDIAFSPDSRYLLSAGGDGCVLVHDLEGSTMPVVQLSECHAKFCRGVAWDPWNRFLVTFGSGPALQCFSHVPKRVTENAVRRMSVAGQKKCQGEFIGDACQLFFRRISWSPDGTLLAVPFGKAGHISQIRKTLSASTTGNEEADEGPTRGASALSGGGVVEIDMVHCVNLYARNAMERVAARIVIRGFSEVRGVAWAPCFLEPLPPSPCKPISSCPPLAHSSGSSFADVPNTATVVEVETLEHEKRGGWGPKTYRMALATWTPDAVIVYTTDSSVRHSDFTDLHMRSITDIAWAPDASYLLTAALDGYVSVIAFRGTLSRTHRLPLFSSSAAVRSMCDVFTGFQKIGMDVENSYSKFSTASAAETAVAAVVKKKKKKRTEDSGDVTTIDPDQLLAIMTDS